MAEHTFTINVPLEGNTRKAKYNEIRSIGNYSKLSEDYQKVYFC
jgi:hypothetical protein